MIRRSAASQSNKIAARASAKKTSSSATPTISPSRVSTQRMSSEEATKNAPKPGSLRGLPRNEFIYICTIFAITGSSAAFFVRPAIKAMLTSTSAGLMFAERIGIHEPQEASLMNGPWSFRLLYFSLMMPMYSLLLFTYGTLLGRGLFFRHFLVKMWSRMLPKPLHDRMKIVLLGIEA